MANGTIRKIIISLIISVIFAIIGYIIAIPISNYFHDSIKDVMFLEGLAVTIIGLIASVQGNPSGINLMRLGDKTGEWSDHANLETTRRERESTNYFKNFTKHSIVNFTLNRLTIVLAGILMILFSLYVL